MLNQEECKRAAIKTVLNFDFSTAAVIDVQNDKVKRICCYLNVNDRNSRIPLAFYTLKGNQQDTLQL